MTSVAHALLWIARITSALAALGGLVLSYMCIRWARSAGDRRTGVYLGLGAVAQSGIPCWGLHLLVRGHTATALLIGAFWALISIAFLAIWPTLVSAAGQP